MSCISSCCTPSKSPYQEAVDRLVAFDPSKKIAAATEQLFGFLLNLADEDTAFEVEPVYKERVDALGLKGDERKNLLKKKNRAVIFTYANESVVVELKEDAHYGAEIYMWTTNPEHRQTHKITVPYDRDEEELKWSGQSAIVYIVDQVIRLLASKPE